MVNLYSTYKHVIYIILHYCSLWMIVTCLISSFISWRLFKIFDKQNLKTMDSYIAWWAAAACGGLAMAFLFIGFLFT